MEIVNATVLARDVLKCSPPTLLALMRRHRDFPIEEAGGRGRSYRFDPAKVLAFVMRKCELGFGGSVADPHELTPGQELSSIRAERERLKFGIESGLLMRTDDVRQVLTQALANFGKFLDRLPGMLARDHGLPADKAEATRETLDGMRRAFAREITEVFAATPEEPEAPGEIVPFERPDGPA